MKEIQFRVWNPDNRIMVYSAELVNTGSGVIVDVRCGALHAEYQDRKTLSWNEAELMQYTGLHDKNGKEIYEGDILESISELVTLDGRKAGKMGTTIVETVWMEDKDGWGNRCLSSNTRMVGSTWQGLSIYAKSSEVIGNIYENPDLIGGSNA